MNYEYDQSKSLISKDKKQDNDKTMRVTMNFGRKKPKNFPFLVSTECPYFNIHVPHYIKILSI